MKWSEFWTVVAQVTIGSIVLMLILMLLTYTVGKTLVDVRAYAWSEQARSRLPVRPNGSSSVSSLPRS